ncbi:hypothetical protein [Pyxidicoccus caerfyrddinensis]|uniref:hypothetical protein n=1 Tax=Pyxidicoccus caerfyrddinensis TaxID=2709663 RepID=UPI001F07C9F0|nr:hypothetical protein [Pyxidicoccus caerfyrddinensis]
MVDTVADAVATPRWTAYKRVSGGAKLWMDPRWKSLDRLERRKALEDATQAGELVELPAHEVLCLLESSHPEFPGREVRKLAQLHLDLAGETFLWLRMDQDVGGAVVRPQSGRLRVVYQAPQPPGWRSSTGLAVRRPRGTRQRSPGRPNPQ